MKLENKPGGIFMKGKSRVLCILFAAALSASVLAGCGNSNSDNNNSNNSNNDRNNSGSSTDVPVQSETQETEPETSGAAQEAVSGESIVTNGGEEIALASLEHQDEASDAVVYYTSDISPQAMLDIYAALGVELTGDNIAVKLSTGNRLPATILTRT